MWSVEYVQVPCESKKDNSLEEVFEKTEINGVVSVVKDQQRHQRRDSCNSYDEEKTAADKLQQFKDLDLIGLDTEVLGSSLDSESHLTSSMRHRGKVQSESRLEKEDSAISSLSDRGEDVISNDSEVVSLSGSCDLAIDMAVDALSVTPIPSQSEPDLMTASSDTIGCDRSQSQPDLKDIPKESEPILKSMSSDFEVISDKEVKGSPKTVEDLMRKYKGKPRNVLREGKESGTSGEGGV